MSSRTSKYDANIYVTIICGAVMLTLYAWRPIGKTFAKTKLFMIFCDSVAWCVIGKTCKIKVKTYRKLPTSRHRTYAYRLSKKY